MLEANWNSAHDNAFVWLTLAQAILFPFLLFLLDARLNLALKRSLKCSSSTTFDKTSGLPSLAEMGAIAGHQQRASHLIMGPSLDDADFAMLAYGGTSAGPTRNPLYQPPPGTSKHTCHTGPPYPVPSFGTFADDGSHDTLKANFALVGKTTQQELLPPELLTPNALLSHQRQRHQHRRRCRSKSALLDITRRILKLGRTKAYQRTAVGRAGIGSGHELNCGEAPGSNSTSSSAGGGPGTNQRRTSGRLSPTSSLSTLIRKFNHDNYTSVCQQYQQRKAQVAREQLVELGASTTADSTKEGCLIEGLDLPSSMQQDSLSKQLTTTPDRQNILCRKGGLYYNYCLDSESPAPSELGARMNPMLSGGGLQPFVVDVVRSSMDKLELEVSQSKKLSSSTTTTISGEPLTKLGLQVNQLEEKKNGSNDKKKKKKKQLELSKTSAISRESNKPGRAKKKPESSGGDTDSKLDSGGAPINTPTTTTTTTNNNNNGNNHTIISNLTSVQELLDKMNGMMGCNGQLQAENKANQSSEQPHRQISNNGQHPKSEMDTCASSNQSSSKQSDDKLATQKRSADAGEYMSLDYATYRSLEDALSLVSVSSDFEYHNINQDELRVATGGVVSSGRPTEAPVSNKQPQQGSDNTKITMRQSEQEEGNLLLLSTASSSLCSSSSSVGTSSDTNKRLNDLRFPSFLPTKLNLERNRAPRSSARGSSTSSGSSIQPSFQKRASSSSLLNLTNAKFAAASAASGLESKLSKQQLSQQFTGSSNTIVKQKGVSKAGKVLVDGTGASQQVTQSRAIESGHVRARIRKMEQQSVPNLNSSQQVFQQPLTSPSNSKSRLPTLHVAANSPMISATSKLPVPTGLLLQHQRSSQPFSTSSSSTSDNNNYAKKTSKQRVGSTQASKHR